jgi:chromosome partitioning protein
MVFETVIPRNVRLGEAPSYGKPIIHYDIGCSGAEAYLQFTRELLSNDTRSVG